MADGQFFQTEKKGEIAELRKSLHDTNKTKRKDALKKIIASMTVGKDVSTLFPDVVNCMQTNNIELKKLVYLYIINYARAQPELAILAINTFRNDSLDPNPLIRGLAIRTMGCIRLDQVTEYLMEPLRRCCKENDPYVRKTASMCIAKLYDVSPQMIEDQGFIQLLIDMIGDSNPMVVANSVAALAEISDSAPKHYLKEYLNTNEQSVPKLLTAINDCTEWSQVFLLDALILYDPTSSTDAENILDRITSRLSHANSAVVLSAAKLVMKLLDHITDEDVIRITQRKLSPPLVTLLSSEPEIQYVALRNMNLIIQKRPLILASDVKMFFCKYNDPVYVKMEKIDIMVRLSSERNISEVIREFKEYATEVDVDFVRSSVRGIGRCAIKIESAAETCIFALLDLIESRVNYVVQEAIVVIKDIFRKYPNRYESIISALCENLDSLDEPEAKASMIWIIGEYAERIDNADELLNAFMNSFQDENSSVQLQILTSTVKLFLKRPKSTQALVTKLLTMCTEKCNNPDVRDRAYIYWRLLAQAPDEARKVVLCEKPTINNDAYSLEPKLLDKLIENISMLASIYHKPPDSFTNHLKNKLEDMDSDSEYDSEANSDLVEKTRKQLANEPDLIGEDEGDDINKADTASASGSDISDTLSTFLEMGRPSTTQVKVEKTLVLNSTDTGKNGATGLEIQAGFARIQGTIQLHMTFTNKFSSNLSAFQIFFRPNLFGLEHTSALDIPVLTPSQSYDTILSMAPNKNILKKAPGNQLFLQTAVKCDLDLFFFSIPYDLSLIFVESQPLDKESFKKGLQECRSQDSTKKILKFIAKADEPFTEASLIRTLSLHNYYFIDSWHAPTYDACNFQTTTTNGFSLYYEIFLQKAGNAVSIEIGGDASLLVLNAISITKILHLSPNK